MLRGLFPTTTASPNAMTARQHQTHPCARSPFAAAAALLVLALALATIGASPALGQPSQPGGGNESSGGISLAFDGAPLSVVLTAVGRTANIQVVAKGKVNPTEKVSFIAAGDSLSVVLDKIIGPREWVWRLNDATGVYEIWDKQTYESTVLAGLMIDKTFSPRFIKAEDALASVQPLINTDKGGSVAVDARTNKIFVRDLPEVVQEIARLLDELDVNLVTRVFRVRHADVTALSEKLAVYKSEPGTIDVDERTHQIIVTDIEQNIKRMELLVDVLDVGPELYIYDLNNIGFEGADVEELRSAIERIVTPDAFFEINYQAGTLLLEDVEEVHERVELLLDAFDPPPKQVLIEAEIIETNFNRQLSYGLQGQFSQDLFGATQDGLFGDQVPTGATATETNPLGFINFREEFPIANLLGDGTFVLSNLSSTALLTLQAALTDTDTQILLQPRLIVKNHETATIEVGGEEPISNPVFNDMGQIISTTRSSVREGLFLELRPSISNTGLVEIEVNFENDDAERAGVDGSGNPLVRRSTQQIETVLIIPSGETRVIGGLLANSQSDTDNGIPFLIDIPWIGPLLFGNKENISMQRHIMVFFTPTIIEESPRRSRVRYRPFTRREQRDQLSGDRSESAMEGEESERRGIPADEYQSGRSANRRDEKADAGAGAIESEASIAEGSNLLSGAGGTDGAADAGDSAENAGGEAPMVPGLDYNDLGIEFDEEGGLVESSAMNAADTGPGAQDSSLMASGALRDDAEMLSTLGDAGALEYDPEIGSYQLERKGPGSSGGSASGGRRPGNPVARPAPGAAVGRGAQARPNPQGGQGAPPAAAVGVGKDDPRRRPNQAAPSPVQDNETAYK